MEKQTQTAVTDYMRLNTKTGKTSFVHAYTQRKRQGSKEKKETENFNEMPHPGTNTHPTTSSPAHSPSAGDEPLLIYPEGVKERVQDVVTEYGYKNKVVDILPVYNKGIRLLIPKIIKETKPTAVIENFKSFKTLSALISKLKAIKGITPQAVYSNLNIEKELIQFVYRLDTPTPEIANSVKELFNDYFNGSGLVAEFNKALSKIPIFRENMLAGLVLPIDYDYLFTLPQAQGDKIEILRIQAINNLLGDSSTKFSYMVSSTTETGFYMNRIKEITKNLDLLNSISLVRINLIHRKGEAALSLPKDGEVKAFGILKPNQMGYFMTQVLTYQQQGEQQNERSKFST